MKRKEKGYGNIRRRDDGRWEARYVDISGKRKSIYGKTKTEVREKLDELVYVKNETSHDTVSGDITLSTWFPHYIEIKAYQVKQQSIDQIKSAFYNHIEPLLGKKILCQINMSDIARTLGYIKKKGLSRITVLNITTHMRAMFNFAVQEGLLKSSPMFTIKNECTRTTTKRALTSEEINLIFSYVYRKDYQFYFMLCTMLLTGMRPGEVCGLKWEDFSDDFNIVRVTESITRNKYGTDTKTEYSVRDIPLTEFLQKEFKKQHQLVNKATGYVFINRNRQHYNSTYMSRRFKDLKENLEDTMDIDLGKITPHYLRHTFATLGVQSGVNITNLSRILGHADTSMLLNVYSHATIKDKAESVEKIAENVLDFLAPNGQL